MPQSLLHGGAAEVLNLHKQVRKSSLMLTVAVCVVLIEMVCVTQDADQSGINSALYGYSCIEYRICVHMRVHVGALT